MIRRHNIKGVLELEEVRWPEFRLARRSLEGNDGARYFVGPRPV